MIATYISFDSFNKSLILLPMGLDLGTEVAIDTETMGLNINRDKLCLVQLQGNIDSTVHIVRFTNDYNAPNLGQLLINENIVKIFHFARFDVAVLLKYLNVLTANIYCTKIASKLVRTYTSSHGLKDLCLDLLGITLNKEMQQSNWGKKEISDAQLQYAAQDVVYLHKLKAALTPLLQEYKREGIAKSCFQFMVTRAFLDILGWSEEDIFKH